MKIGYIIDFFVAVVFIIALFHLQWGMVLAIFACWLVQLGLAIAVDLQLANSIDKNFLNLLPDKVKQREAARENMPIICLAAGMKLVLLIVSIVSLIKLMGH